MRAAGSAAAGLGREPDLAATSAQDRCGGEARGVAPSPVSLPGRNLPGCSTIPSSREPGPCLGAPLRAAQPGRDPAAAAHGCSATPPLPEGHLASASGLPGWALTAAALGEASGLPGWVLTAAALGEAAKNAVMAGCDASIPFGVDLSPGLPPLAAAPPAALRLGEFAGAFRRALAPLP